VGGSSSSSISVSMWAVHAHWEAARPPSSRRQKGACPGVPVSIMNPSDIYHKPNRHTCSLMQAVFHVVVVVVDVIVGIIVVVVVRACCCISRRPGLKTNYTEK